MQTHTPNYFQRGYLEDSDLLKRRCDSVFARTIRVGGCGVIPEGAIAIRHIGFDRASTIDEHRDDKEIRSQQVLILNCKSLRVRRIVEPQRSHNRRAIEGGLVEDSVEVRKRLIALNDGKAELLHPLGTVDPGLPARRVEVGMSAEKGLIGAELIPTEQEFRGGVTKETANVSADKGDASETHANHHTISQGIREGEDEQDEYERREGRVSGPHEHRLRRSKVIPIGLVVTRPNGAPIITNIKNDPCIRAHQSIYICIILYHIPALSASEESAREDEGAFVLGGVAMNETHGSGTMHHETIEIVHMTMLPTTMMPDEDE